MHFSHFLNFVKVDNEASLISVVLFDAFSAKNSEMVWTVEMLHPLIMFVTKQTFDTIFILKIDISQNVVTLYYFI